MSEYEVHYTVTRPTGWRTLRTTSTQFEGAWDNRGTRALDNRRLDWSRGYATCYLPEPQSGIPPHRKIRPDCTCGFYVLRERKFFGGTPKPIAHVELYGQVFEHDTYYRCSWYEPTYIIVPRHLTPPHVWRHYATGEPIPARDEYLRDVVTRLERDYQIPVFVANVREYTGR